jgi:hypothetical protein
MKASQNYTHSISHYTAAHVTSHTKFSNSFFGHTVVPLELLNSSEVYYSALQLMSASKQHLLSLINLLKTVTWSLSSVVSRQCLRSCLETDCMSPLFCSCMRVVQGVYRAVAYQCVDISQYFHKNWEMLPILDISSSFHISLLTFERVIEASPRDLKCSSYTST